MPRSTRQSAEPAIEAKLGPEAAGAIAAIAHDLNNILTGIVTFAELLEHDVPEGGGAAEDAREIGAQAKRAAVRVKELFGIARGGVKH